MRTRGLKLSTRLLHSTLTVGGMTLLSRIFGLLRDITIATLFGASGGTDAFLVAFKIPNFMRRLFAEGAFSQAFVPVLSEYKENFSREQLRDLIDHVAGKLGGILLVISIVGSLAAPALVYIFAPGFSGDDPRFDMTVDLLRITFPYLFFIALVAFAGGILNSFGKFAIPAFTPVLLNLSLIGSAYWLAPLFDEPLMALGWGVAIGGVAQFLLQLPSLLRLGLLPRPRFATNHAGVSKILRLMLPAVFGSSVAQINLLLDTVIASFLVTGSVSWLYYSDRLLEFPLGVLGIAVATVILPVLSSQHARATPQDFNATLNWAMRLVLVVAAPACIGLLLLAAPILAALFQYGEFTARDTHLTSLSLMAYILGLPGFILIKVLAPGFYARQDTKTPVKVAITALVSNMVLNIVFVSPLVLLNYEAPHVGLALATTCSAYINAGMLYFGLRRDGVLTLNAGTGKLLLRIVFGCSAMGLALWQVTPEMAVWNAAASHVRLTMIGGIIALAALAYFASLWLAGMRASALRRSA